MKSFRTRWMIMTALLFVVMISGCTTTTQFRLPPGTDIMIKGERFSAEKDGYADVTVTPFFWTGIHYVLVHENKVIERGTMDSHFRIVTIIFPLPPAAIFYWPKGFSYDCYDMTKKSAEGEPEPCTPVKHEAKIRKRPDEEKPPWQGAQ